ncbi:hypothetical protein Emed_000009 [Eimeria media]
MTPATSTYSPQELSPPSPSLVSPVSAGALFPQKQSEENKADLLLFEGGIYHPALKSSFCHLGCAVLRFSPATTDAACKRRFPCLAFATTATGCVAGAVFALCSSSTRWYNSSNVLSCCSSRQQQQQQLQQQQLVQQQQLQQRVQLLQLPPAAATFATATAATTFSVAAAAASSNNSSCSRSNPCSDKRYSTSCACSSTNTGNNTLCCNSIRSSSKKLCSTIRMGQSSCCWKKGAAATPLIDANGSRDANDAAWPLTRCFAFVCSSQIPTLS